MTQGAIITGWGTALPDTMITNHDLEKLMETSDEWIVERTGIKTRYWGDEGAGALAARACTNALTSAQLEPADIDLLLLATCSPDYMLPGSSALVQHELGLTCGAIDLNAACSGFVYSLVMAHGMVQMGYERILVVGTEQLSSIIDKHDRGTAILFGDGAGAVVLQAGEGPGQLLGHDLGVDGAAAGALYCKPGQFTQMDGKEVFRRAVRAMVDSAMRALERSGLTMDDIDWVVPHQANMRIIQAAIDRLGWPLDRTSINLERVGNTSAASIPLAMDHELNAGNIVPGDNVLLCGFGAGMTWASAVLRWGGVIREGGHGKHWHAANPRVV